MKKIILPLMLLSALILSLSSCSNSKKDKKGREDFSIFIDKFYADIEFQLSRIEFPITGAEDESGKIEIIEKEDWTVLKPIERNNPDYETFIFELSDDLIEQRIIVKKTFIIKLQFSLNPVTKEWYLSSYPGIKGASGKVKSSTENEDVQIKVEKDQKDTLVDTN